MSLPSQTVEIRRQVLSKDQTMSKHSPLVRKAPANIHIYIYVLFLMYTRPSNQQCAILLHVGRFWEETLKRIETGACIFFYVMFFQSQVSTRQGLNTEAAFDRRRTTGCCGGENPFPSLFGLENMPSLCFGKMISQILWGATVRSHLCRERIQGLVAHNSVKGLVHM